MGWCKGSLISIDGQDHSNCLANLLILQMSLLRCRQIEDLSKASQVVGCGRPGAITKVSRFVCSELFLLHHPIPL